MPQLSPVVRQVAHRFVPRHNIIDAAAVRQLQSYLDECTNLLVITGAGISTESGIPDYRSEGVGRYATSTTRPMTYQKFVSSEADRKRHWARNYVGWPSFSSFSPNITHNTLAKWQNAAPNSNRLAVITQNVDNLHRDCEHVALHGSSHNVRCFECQHKDLQNSLDVANSSWRPRDAVSSAPDGDVDLSEDDVSTFTMVNCPECHNMTLMPDVVFFGDNVPKSTVEKCYELVRTSDAVLALGSSFTVMSSYRFLVDAHKSGKNVYMVNIGASRADPLVTCKVEGRVGDVMEKLTWPPN